ncbi:sigma factor-like helix-turn-helix DNA-binding protein [Burkholderia lata]|nr:sigma factor-like helix-turn-helix DNA-binding protein [Burkholderia lata]
MLAGSIWLIDLRQRNHRNGLVLELSDTLLETVSDSGSPETGPAIRPIVNATGRLQESRRTALLLVSVDGRRYRQAADTLDIPTGTIVIRISRERKAIRMVFDGSGESRMETGHRIDGSADVDVRRRPPADATRPRHNRPRGESHGNKRSPSRVQCWQSRPLPCM